MSPDKIAAIAYVKNQLGLTNTNPADWSYDTRIKYNKALSLYLIQNAPKFTESEVNIARNVQESVYSPLADVSFASDLSVFGTEFANQALRVGDGVAAIGNGVVNTAQLAKWVLPAAALVIVVILLREFQRKHS